jgi:hypothetical protein
MCGKCYQYARVNKRRRPLDLHSRKVCIVCGVPPVQGHLRRGRCRRHYDAFMKNGLPDHSAAVSAIREAYLRGQNE